MSAARIDPSVAAERNEDVPPLGSTLAGRYVLEEAIGTGGMSVVVRARDLRLDTHVAVKLLRRSRLTRGAPLARFVREAHVVARLRSDYVVRVLDVDAAHDPPYLVMELVSEGDVGRLLGEKRPLPRPLAIEILLQSCRGVADTHAVDVVHRDLKPSNLLLARTAQGALRVKIADFGISKVLGAQGELDLTSSDQIVGSPRYMSPEQIRGVDVDSRTDVWSLGVIAYELLSARAPFDASTLGDMLARIVSEPPAPFEGEDVPARLGALVGACLEKDRAERPPISALIAEIEAIQRETPYSSTAPAADAPRVSSLSRPSAEAGQSPTSGVRSRSSSSPPAGGSSATLEELKGRPWGELRRPSSIQVLLWQDIFAVVDDGKAAPAEYDLLGRLIIEQAARFPAGIGCLAIIPRNATRPSDESRAALDTGLAKIEGALRCMCWLVEGEGFQGAMVRAILTGLRIVTSRAYPTHVSTDLDEALLWLLQRLPRSGRERRSGEVADAHAALVHQRKKGGVRAE